MNWFQLNSLTDLDKAIELSSQFPILILKHSTRCSVSRFALRELEQKWIGGAEQKVIPYFLDLLNHRDISAAIEERLGVRHESPQALLIRNGKCIYYATHSEINYQDIMQQVK